jgi:putative transport protein
MMIGTLYGAVTNTPGLGAAQEALSSIMGANTPAIANGYACAYPLGVIGIIGATIAIRYICRVKLQDEEEALNSKEDDATSKPHMMHLIVMNEFLAGHTILEIHDF